LLIIILFSVSGVRLSFFANGTKYFRNNSAFTDGQKVFKIYSSSGVPENKNYKKIQFLSACSSYFK